MPLLHFFVTDDPAAARALHAGQAACYARYGATAAVAAPTDDASARWLAVTAGDTFVAGIRIHTRRPLPLEAFFAGHDVVGDELARRGREGIAELCGLWSAPDVAGSGIGGLVVGAAVAIAPRLDLRYLCSFAHQFNRFTRAVGFEPDPRIGEHPYPDPRYRSTVNWCDARLLPTAEAAWSSRIARLRAAIAGRALDQPMRLELETLTRRSAHG